MDSTTNEELIRTYDQLSADPSFQTSLPVPPPDPIQPDLSFLNGIFAAIGAFFAFIGPALFWILVVGGIALLCFVLFSIGRAIYERRDRLNALLKKDAPEDVLSTMDVRPDEHFAKNLLSEADKLASEGRYGEAIRLLLHSSISDMQERIHKRIGVSLTAREIGQLGSIPDDSRSALHRIIYTVEINVFGEQDVSSDDFVKARHDYTVFAFKGDRK